jgi:tetratricopeptide (TPR) repeat protein
VTDPPDATTTSNTAGAVTGSVVQAGTIHHLSVGGAPPGDTTPTPRQLPLAIGDFTGRAEHLTELDGLLPDEESVPAAGAVVISALHGTAGVGKTTLAVHWAHRVQARFPDGSLHVNLRGYGPGHPATAAEVLDAFLRALGTQPERIPVDVDAKAALYRSLLAGRRVLVVLDNANSADQVRPLLPGSPGCLVLITSRSSLSGLAVGQSATRLCLDLLTRHEAITLVTGIIGTDRAEADPCAVVALTEACARLPLALRIAASRLASRPHLSVADVVSELADDRQRLQVLSTCADDAATVRVVFDWSYERLTSAQAQLFRHLGLHPGTEFSLHAAAAVGGIDVEQARALLEELSEVHLIEPIARERFRFHDLLRAYAAERASREGTPTGRKRAVRRLFDWYAYTAAVADDVLFPDHSTLSHEPGPAPKVTLTPFTHADALRWFHLERANLIAATRHASDYAQPHETLRLADGLREFLFHRVYWNDLLTICDIALEAARRSGDRAAEARNHVMRSERHTCVANWEQAQEDARRGIDLAQALSDPHIRSYALNALGWCYLRQHRYSEAIEALRTGLPFARQLEVKREEAVIEGNLSLCHTGLGNYEQAQVHAERSLAVHRSRKDPAGEALALHQAAMAWQGIGDHEKAIQLCEKSLQIGKDFGHPPEMAATLDTLGAVSLSLGHLERAATHWRAALAIFEQYGDHRVADLRERMRDLKTGKAGSS